MAKISTYPQPTPPSLGDYVIGTDISDLLMTKNYLISDILALATLDMVLHNGDSSLLSANVGSIGLWDEHIDNGNGTFGSYGNIGFAGGNPVISTLIIRGGGINTPILFYTSDEGVVHFKFEYKDPTFYFNQITDSRFWTWQDRDGIVALIDDVLGKIKIIDLSNEVFNSLDTARAYVQSFTSATIYNDSYWDGIYKFSVPQYTAFTNQNGFLSGYSASFQDPYGLVTSFSDDCFLQNQGNNIFLNISVGNNFLYQSIGNNIIRQINSGNDLLSYSTGDNIIDFIATVDYSFSFSSGSNKIKSIGCGSGFLGSSSGSNSIGNVKGLDGFLGNSSGNNTINDIDCTANFLNQSSGNNTIGNISTGESFLMNSTGDNIIGNVTCTDNFLNGSSGNNVIGDVNAGGKFLSSSTGDNKIGNVSATNLFLNGSTGNNIIGNVICTDDFLRYSIGNNTMNTINVGLYAFQYAAPTIKNSIYKIETCDANFANEYIGRMDVGVWGNTSGADLPTDIFTTNSLTWIRTFYSNNFNNGGTTDLDVVQALSNIQDGDSNSNVFFD